MARTHDLPSIARQLDEHSQRIREALVQTKRWITENANELRELMTEIHISVDRVKWLVDSRRITETAATDGPRPDGEETKSHEDEETSEREHLRFLRQEHTRLVHERSVLTRALRALSRQLLSAWAQERILATAAQRLGLSPLGRRPKERS